MFGHETDSSSERSALLIANFVRISVVKPARAASVAVADLVERVVMDEEAAVAAAVVGVLPSMQDVCVPDFMIEGGREITFKSAGWGLI